MAELRDLYQEVILEHSKVPRNYRVMTEADHKAEGFNPLCGDRFTVYLHMDRDAIRDISFQGSGCAISKASASIMTDALKGKTAVEAKELFRNFHDLITTGKSDSKELNKLVAFGGVNKFPARVKCASLSWHTMHAALNNQELVSTE